MSNNNQHTPNPAPVDNPDPLLTVNEAARYLNVSPRFVYRMAAEGRLTPVRLSANCLRHRMSDLERFLSAHTTQGQR